MPTRKARDRAAPTSESPGRGSPGGGPRLPCVDGCRRASRAARPGSAAPAGGLEAGSGPAARARSRRRTRPEHLGMALAQIPALLEQALVHVLFVEAACSLRLLRFHAEDRVVTGREGDGRLQAVGQSGVEAGAVLPTRTEAALSGRGGGQRRGGGDQRLVITRGARQRL